MKDLLLKLHNSGFLTIILVAIVGVATFSAGRYSAPTKVQTVEKQVVVTQEKVQIVQVEKASEDKTKDQNSQKHVHRERTETTSPDGTKVVKVVTDVNVDKTIKETDVKVVTVTNTVEKQVEIEKKVEVTKTIERARPDWFLSAKLGTNFSTLKVSATAPYINPLLIGVDGNRRIIGPLFLGLWALTSTDFKSISGGLSASMEF
jgi:hypothetical protein